MPETQHAHKTAAFAQVQRQMSRRRRWQLAGRTHRLEALNSIFFLHCSQVTVAVSRGPWTTKMSPK